MTGRGVALTRRPQTFLPVPELLSWNPVRLTKTKFPYDLNTFRGLAERVRSRSGTEIPLPKFLEPRSVLSTLTPRKSTTGTTVPVLSGDQPLPSFDNTPVKVPVDVNTGQSMSSQSTYVRIGRCAPTRFFPRRRKPYGITTSPG